ncbi:MAG: hypothetical protein AWU54_1755 [Candidatus Frackibacter sp. T328-2]|nr:MAG: hypothetical protein AWU54_1755 [Candidatus Frackibacter sp. T328-2]
MSVLMLLFGGQALAGEIKSTGHPLNGCSSCHLPHGAHGDKLWTFTPNLQTQKGTKLISINALCYSCHDGTITSKGKDFFDNLKTTHPVGVKIPDYMTIPDDFPLDHKERMTCGTCHNPHNSDAESYLRVSNKTGKLCVSCHVNQGE